MQTLSETDSREAVKSPTPKQRRINEVLARWDSMPDDSYVRVGVVAALEACSIPTIWRRVQSGALPKPIKLSHQMSGWHVGELRAFRRARAVRVAP